MFNIMHTLKSIFLITNPFILVLYIIFGIIIYFISIYLLDKVFGRKYYESWLWLKKNI